MKSIASEAARAAKDHPRAALISMPWAAVTEPSLGLSTLKAHLREQDISSTVYYFNLTLLKYIRHDTYCRIADAPGINDYVFSHFLSPNLPPDRQSSLREIIREYRLFFHGIQDVDYSLAILNAIRSEAIPRFIDECSTVLHEHESNSDLIGFTCLFDQTFASLALAAQLRTKWPTKPIVLGGYAVEAPVGLQILKSFSFISAVAQGDGEFTLSQLINAVASDKRPDIPGVTWQDDLIDEDRLAQKAGERPRAAFSDSPPDFNDYFHQVDSLRENENISIKNSVLPMELSRGCWWGQKNHCIFCGIDSDSMNYRSSDAQRAFNSISHINSVYPDKLLRFSDYIFPRPYFQELLPALAGLQSKPRLGAEMKSNMRPEEIQLLKAAGFEHIQIGLESFSSAVLRHMRKGVSAFQNILTLRLAQDHDIDVHYNLLFGFAGEQAEWYRDQISLIRRIFHLKPPGALIEVQTTRYAPMQTGIEGYKEATEPADCYSVILNPDEASELGFDLSRYCYYFKKTYSPKPELQALYKELQDVYAEWRQSWDFGLEKLHFDDSNGEISFTRFSRGRKSTIELDAVAAEVYKLVDHKVHSVNGIMNSKTIETIKPSLVRAALDKMYDLGLIEIEGDLVLGLALRGKDSPQKVPLRAASSA